MYISVIINNYLINIEAILLQIVLLKVWCMQILGNKHKIMLGL